MIASGIGKWFRTQTPSEKTDMFASKYSVDLFVDDETKEKLLAEGLEIRQEKDSEKQLTGLEFFRFWAHGTHTKTGKANKPIRLVDKYGKPMEDEPGNGSEIQVQFLLHTYTKGGGGVSGILQAVKVNKLVGGSANEFEFEDEEELDEDIPF